MSVLDTLKEMQQKIEELSQAITEKEDELGLMRQERDELQSRVTLATEVATSYELDSKEKLKSDSEALAELYLCFKTGELNDDVFKRFCEQTSIGMPDDLEEEKPDIHAVPT